MSVKIREQRLITSLLSIAIASLSFAAISTPSAAQEIVAQRVNCNKAVTTPELKYCSQLSYQAADKRLNEVYKKVTSSLINEQRQIFVSAQQAWIKFRDNNCNFETYGSRDGTGYEIFRNGCLERLQNNAQGFARFFISVIF
ncbi:lysozyme inhibitor LprI family protein [Scytonema sp. UIC 10036]|uniref:lysozyme inhibitor LprI family protein n=1 Tax=Scytonema sp. UIC 10036 TaxID=2304196 RepID=UPI00140F73DA|nr:lysozyme inhibitor LprI family protein [Scytonema sp. UIC 10036]